MLTLAMACVFMAGWARSYLLLDAVGYDRPSAGDGVHWAANLQLVSFDGAIDFESSEPVLQWPDKQDWKRTYSVLESGPVLYGREDEVWSYPPRWKWAGFAFDDVDYMRLTIPYWSIVPPLTLISAWLLLSKPPGRRNVRALPSI